MARHRFRHLTSGVNAPSGFTVMEVIMYVSALVVIVLFSTLSVAQLSKPIARLKNTRVVNEVGAYTMDQIIKQVRSATMIGSVALPPADNEISYSVRGSFADVIRCGPTTPCVNQGVIAHWNFEEENGNVLRDVIGGFNGTITSGTAGAPMGYRAPAIIGNALSFSGDDYVTLPLNAFNSHTKGAIEIIYKSKRSAIETFTDTLFSTSKGNTQSFAVGLLRSACSDGGHKIFTPNFTLLSGSCYSKEQYYHLVVQHDGTTTNMFVNGVQLPDIPAGSNAWFSTYTDGGYHIGLNDYGGAPMTASFIGEIDELIIYSDVKPKAFWEQHARVIYGTETPLKPLVLGYDSASSRVLIEDAGAISYLSSYSAKILDFSVTPLLIDGTIVGVNISFNVSAGSGDNQVKKYFQTTSMLRNL